MAIVFDGSVSPADLISFVRNIPTPDTLALSALLPDKFVTSNRVDISTLTKTGRTAQFRPFDAPLRPSPRDIANLKTVHLPPLSDARSTGEFERLQLEFARSGGTNQNAFINAMYNDAVDLTLNMQRRMELARGDVLLDGKFTLNEGGLNVEADFGLPAGNVVTAGTLWSTTATADVIADLNTWVTYYIGLNGYEPGGMWINRTVLNNLLANTLLRTQMGTTLGIANLLTRSTVAAILDQHGLPPILGVYDTQVDVEGTSTRVLPVNKILIVPPAGTDLGHTVWGVSATALELVNSSRVDLSFENAPGIVGVVEKVGPPYREFVFIDAVGMPVLENPNALMVATVG